MIYLGLDYGGSRVGVAVGDDQMRFASPHGFFIHKGWGPDTRQVQALMAETGASAVVLGMPLNMDGSLGGQAGETRGFGQRLEAAGIRVIYQDERFTSLEAEAFLREAGYDSRQIKEKVDQAAACMILQRYLDSLGYNK